jgi:tight adherence protein C
MLVLIYIFAFGAVALISASLYLSKRSSAIRLRLPKAEEVKDRQRRISLQTLPINIIPSRKFLERIKLDVKIKQRLDAAHIKLTAQEFFNIKLILMAFFIFAGMFVAGEYLPIALTASMLMGYMIPEFWVNKKIAARKQVIVQLLPETVDLLGLCVEAGLDFTTSVKWVIEKVPVNALLEELQFVLEEIKWGKPRSQALKDMSKRLNIPEISSFTHTLIQAERMGVPVVEAFTILSEDTRLQRFHRGERFAMQAPIKILLPLIFCILPVIGIVVGGPILLQFMQGGMLTGIGK